MKKIVVMVAVAMAALMSQASYLYWQVSQADAAKFTYTVDGETQANFATIMRVDGSGVVSDVSGPGSDAGLVYNATSPSGSAMASQGVYLGDLQEAGRYSYFIELSNWDYADGSASWSDRTVLGQSEVVSYADLASRGFVLEQLTIPAHVWTGGAYSAPEPTSGMLLLVGLGLLALRRRV